MVLAVDPPSDPYRYSEAELKRLTENLAGLIRSSYAEEFAEYGKLDPRLLREFHHRFFRGVRSHGGRLRGKGVGPERVTFLGRRSFHSRDVERCVSTLLAVAKTLIPSEDDVDFDRECLVLAARLHVELVRIQPFEDGNKRVSARFANHFLREMGLQPITLEVESGQYHGALISYLDERPLSDDTIRARYDSVMREFLRDKNLDPLSDLFVRLYLDQLSGPAPTND